MDIDSRLREAGQRWRASQGPSLEHPSPASLEDDAPTRKWWKGLVPLAAAAAAAGIIFGIVSLHGATTGGHLCSRRVDHHARLMTRRCRNGVVS